MYMTVCYNSMNSPPKQLGDVRVDPGQTAAGYWMISCRIQSKCSILAASWPSMSVWSRDSGPQQQHRYGWSWTSQERRSRRTWTPVEAQIPTILENSSWADPNSPWQQQKCRSRLSWTPQQCRSRWHWTPVVEQIQKILDTISRVDPEDPGHHQ